jgi:ketosteroid isomerase-like protein
MKPGGSKKSCGTLLPWRTPVRTRGILFCALGVLVVTLALPAWSQTTQRKPLPALEGKLLEVPGKGPVLKMADKEQELTATTTYLFHTLQDKRLAGREVRVEGRPQPDGTFQVEWLFTIRDGKLYRVRYYCRTCNLVALGPGKCVCCQHPTELQEIPVSDSSEYQ